MKKREEDELKLKADQNRWKVDSDAKKREEDELKVKADQSRRKVKSNMKKRGKDELKLKADQNRWKRLSRNKRKLIDPDGLSKYENEVQRKKRRLWGAQDRIREFKEATKYNAIFICSCCHRRLFHSNVEVIDQKLKDSINLKKTGHFRDCVENEIETPINGRKDCYICKTCKGHMRASKMPPMSVRNNLRLETQDEELTELEGSLIAKNLIFLKIYQLPKSRWTALTDKIINVPITNEDINNTVESLPRTPKEAGLIGVALKRKLEYKNTHAKQLVNPNKILKMLDLLKKSHNPHYQIVDDFSTFKERCQDMDPEGYELMFHGGDVLEEDIAMMPKVNTESCKDEISQLPSSNIDSDDDSDEPDSDDDEDYKDEMEYVTKDPIRKYQFDYNKSLCLSHKFPEIDAEDPTKDIEIAPGEGKRPNDILREKDWDIKAFPHLHNPDGSNGKDHERKVRLTDQRIRATLYSILLTKVKSLQQLPTLKGNSCKEISTFQAQGQREWKN